MTVHAKLVLGVPGEELGTLSTSSARRQPPYPATRSEAQKMRVAVAEAQRKQPSPEPAQADSSRSQRDGDRYGLRLTTNHQHLRQREDIPPCAIWAES